MGAGWPQPSARRGSTGAPAEDKGKRFVCKRGSGGVVPGGAERGRGRSPPAAYQAQWSWPCAGGSGGAAQRSGDSKCGPARALPAPVLAPLRLALSDLPPGPWGRLRAARGAKGPHPLRGPFPTVPPLPPCSLPPLFLGLCLLFLKSSLPSSSSLRLDLTACMVGAWYGPVGPKYPDGGWFSRSQLPGLRLGLFTPQSRFCSGQWAVPCASQCPPTG